MRLSRRLVLLSGILFGAALPDSHDPRTSLLAADMNSTSPPTGRKSGGLLWWDRHTHKNGGTTTREIMKIAAMQAQCLYWGFWQSERGWNQTLALLQESAHQHSKLCVEAHYPIDEPPVLTRHRHLMELKTRATEMKVVQTTRVREPLSYYLSYYRWAVGGHVVANESGPSFVDFLEWTPPNLQSNLMLFPTRSDSLEKGLGYGELASYGEAEHNSLIGMLDEFELVGTTERFDEFAIALKLMGGVDPHYRLEAPAQRGLPEGKPMLTDASVCPDMAKCRSHVATLAPYDMLLYARYNASFEAKLFELDHAGQLTRELAKLREWNQDLWMGGPEKPKVCVWSVDHSGNDQPAELASPCDVATIEVETAVKMDTFAKKGTLAAWAPASQAIGEPLLPLQLLDLEVNVADDGSRSWDVLASGASSLRHHASDIWRGAARFA